MLVVHAKAKQFDVHGGGCGVVHMVVDDVGGEASRVVTVERRVNLSGQEAIETTALLRLGAGGRGSEREGEAMRRSGVCVLNTLC